MKLLIFGASGSVGKQLVNQALNNGYMVTAFVRNTQNWPVQSEANLQLFAGDVLDLLAVEKAVKGQDAILCVLGDGKLGKIRAVGTKNIIDAMEKQNVSRFICQTTLGMGESYGNLNFLWKYVMFGMLLKKAFKDHAIQEQHILNSKLNYTIVRPSALTDGPQTDSYKIGFDGKYKGLQLKISRADVAKFMVQQIESANYSCQPVSISA